MLQAEERKRQETENKALIAEQLEKMKLEVQHEKAEIQMRAKQGKQYSDEESMTHEMALADSKADMSVVTLQVRARNRQVARRIVVVLLTGNYCIFVIGLVSVSLIKPVSGTGG